MRISDWSSDVCSSDLCHWQFFLRLWLPEMSGVTLFALAIGESHQIFLRQYIVIALADDGFSGAADELLGIFRSEKIRRFDEDVTGFTPQLIADEIGRAHV